MIEILAHIALYGRHRTTVIVGGYHWRYCNHRSHALGLRCWRWFNYDNYCPKHNRSCWDECPPDPLAVDVYETDCETDF